MSRPFNTNTSGFRPSNFSASIAVISLTVVKTVQWGPAGSHFPKVALKVKTKEKVFAEAFRVLKPGGRFGLGEPMHLEAEIPTDLLPYVSQGEYSWKECFRSLNETREVVRSAGFEILEAEYAPDSQDWWMQYAKHDPFCKQTPDEDPKTLQIDNGRWTSFGYIIGKK